MTRRRRLVWPNPIIGYRQFVDGLYRAIFEDADGQYVCDDGQERIYGLYVTEGEHFLNGKNAQLQGPP